MSFCSVQTSCDKQLQDISCRLFPAHADTIDAAAPTETSSPFCKTVGRACGVVKFDAHNLKRE
jgi:hypothetical protein